MAPDSITSGGKTVMVSLKFFLTMVLTILAFCGGFFLRADAQQAVKMEKVKIVMEEKNREQDVLISCNLRHKDFIQYTRIHGAEHKDLVAEMRINNKEHHKQLADSIAQSLASKVEMIDRINASERAILKELHKITK